MDVRSDGIGELRYFVDEAYFGRQEAVGCILYQFSGGSIGHDDGRIFLDEICVRFLYLSDRFLIVRIESQNDPFRIEKVMERLSFPQKFRIGDDLVLSSQYLIYHGIGSYRNRRFYYYDLCSCYYGFQLIGHIPYLAQIRLSLAILRRSDAKEDDIAVFRCSNVGRILQIIFDFMQKLRESVFIDRRYSLLQFIYLLFEGIDAIDVESEFR